MPTDDPTGIIDETMTFTPAALRALRTFRRSKPWRGTLEERSAKFRSLNDELAAAYEMPTPMLVTPELEGPDSDGGWRRFPDGSTGIALIGKLSVVTYLRLFALARGMTDRRAIRWSVNLFRRVFPRSFANCRLEADGRLVRDVPMVRLSIEADVINPPTPA